MDRTEITVAHLQSVMPQARLSLLETYAQPLADSMFRHAITGVLRCSHFLAQVAQESGQLLFTEEIASGAAYEGRLDLGNTQPGDGPRFKGRGLLQITGRSAYTAFSKYAGVPLLTGQETRRVATEASLAVESAAWFWTMHDLNRLEDRDDIVAITKVINGGLNGYARRHTYLLRAKAAFPAPASPAIPQTVAPTVAQIVAQAIPSLEASVRVPASGEISRFAGGL